MAGVLVRAVAGREEMGASIDSLEYGRLPGGGRGGEELFQTLMGDVFQESQVTVRSMQLKVRSMQYAVCFTLYSLRRGVCIELL